MYAAPAADEQKRQRRWALLLGFMLLAVTTAVFAPAIHHHFVAWDDGLHVYANPRFQSVTWSHVWAFWQAPYMGLYIPLTYTLWSGLVWLHQMVNPGALMAGPFHATNLFLHLANTLLVYRIACLVWRHQCRPSRQHLVIGAAGGALLFALHPLQVEAVAWVSGLRDVLCGALALVALWQYLTHVQADHTRKRFRHYGMASIAFALALLAKPAAVTVPLLAYLIDIGTQGRTWRQATHTLGPWLIIAALWGVGTKLLQSDDILAGIPPLWARPVIAADALTFYLRKLLWPLHLGPDYGRTPQMVLGLGWPLLAGLTPVVFGAVLWRLRRHMPGLSLACGLFAAGLLPVLGIVPFLFQALSTVADRYVYLAMIGPALGFAWLVQYRARCKSVAVVVLLLLGLLAGRSSAQIRIWRDTRTLFTQALQVNPESILAYNNLGLLLAQEGKLDDAISHYHTALQLRPLVPEVHYNLGNALQRQGKHIQALAHYTQAVQLKPTWAEAHNNLGSALDDQGRIAEAIAQYEHALRLNPQLAEARNNLGDALLGQGRIAHAIEQFRTAVQLKPTWAEAHYNLGVALTQGGQWRDALRAYQEAHRLRPAWTKPNIPLALLLLSQPSPAADDARQAVHLASAACHATHNQDAVALYTLARAYQVTGEHEKARQMSTRALTMARATGQHNLATQITSLFPPVKESTHVGP